MTLSFHKMSFSQVSHFVDLLKTYIQDDTASGDVDLEFESNMDVSMQSLDNGQDQSVTTKTRLLAL